MQLDGFPRLLPVYPLIAQQILDDYGIDEGICLDIGTGPGYLGLELAKLTHLKMYFVDLKSEVLDKARVLVEQGGVDNETCFMAADVTTLPFDDAFADLIVSRGSLWFWADQVKGLQEIYRVLKPGAVAFVGGGLGRYTPASMRKRLKSMGRKAVKKSGAAACFLEGDGLEDLVHQAGLTGCRLVTDAEDQPGSWIEVRK